MKKISAEEKAKHQIENIYRNLGTKTDCELYTIDLYHTLTLPEPDALRGDIEIYHDEESRTVISESRARSGQEYEALNWLHSGRAFQYLERFNPAAHKEETLERRLATLSDMQLYMNCKNNPDLDRVFTILTSLPPFKKNYQSLSSSTLQQLYKAAFYGALAVVFFRLLDRYEDLDNLATKAHLEFLDTLAEKLEDVLAHIANKESWIEPTKEAFLPKQLMSDPAMEISLAAALRKGLATVKSHKKEIAPYKKNKPFDLERDYVSLVLMELRTPIILAPDSGSISFDEYKSSLRQGKRVAESLGIVLGYSEVDQKTIDGVIDAISSNLLDAKFKDKDLNSEKDFFLL